MGIYSRVQSVDRAILILKCFTESRRELKLSEISEQLGLNKSTVHGIINTLKYHGLIEQNDKTQKYRLGLSLIELGELVISSMDVRGIAYPIIEEICEKLGETVHVAILNGIDVVYVDKKESNRSIKISSKIGSRFPAYYTADGKVLLAYLDRNVQEQIIPDKIERATANTITDKKQLLEELELVRKQGYAIDDEGYLEGLFCVAAPIFDYTGEVKYGVSITGGAVTMTKEKVNEAIKVLVDATKRISYKLGYRD